MKCTKHPEVEAQGMCMYCGKPFCADCLVEVDGKMYCKDDIAKVVHDAAKQQPAAGQPVINITNTNTNANTNTNQNHNGVGFVGVSRKNKWLAFFLCLFVGYFGFHRFYVGKVGTGIIYFFTGGLFLIGAIIDLLSILFGSFRDSDGLPLR